MQLKEFFSKVDISQYIIAVEIDGSISDVKKYSLYKSIFYMDFGNYDFAYLPYSQEIQLTAEGIRVKDEEDEEIELRFYRRELVDLSKLI